MLPLLRVQPVRLRLRHHGLPDVLKPVAPDAAGVVAERGGFGLGAAGAASAASAAVPASGGRAQRRGVATVLPLAVLHLLDLPPGRAVLLLVGPAAALGPLGRARGRTQPLHAAAWVPMLGDVPSGPGGPGEAGHLAQCPSRHVRCQHRPRQSLSHQDLLLELDGRLALVAHQDLLLGLTGEPVPGLLSAGTGWPARLQDRRGHSQRRHSCRRGAGPPATTGGPADGRLHQDRDQLHPDRSDRRHGPTPLQQGGLA
mmetsp:Transcript_114915/g.349649  ORF Transcript_114915/g.349649 Transcript_114915/m.349649 type:complete len:256 (-) Transcript_114915:28-795(-)